MIDTFDNIYTIKLCVLSVMKLYSSTYKAENYCVLIQCISNNKLTQYVLHFLKPTLRTLSVINLPLQSCDRYPQLQIIQ